MGGGNCGSVQSIEVLELVKDFSLTGLTNLTSQKHLVNYRVNLGITGRGKERRWRVVAWKGKYEISGVTCPPGEEARGYVPSRGGG